jgi:hypothetical protein
MSTSKIRKVFKERKLEKEKESKKTASPNAIYFAIG